MTLIASCRAACLSFLWLACLLPVRASMWVQTYSAARHYRFYAGADPDNTLRNANNWSGVGLSDGTRWGTLVSPSFILSAAHWSPGLATMTFYPDNTGANAVTRTVDAAWQVSGTDLWVGHLSSAAPSNIAYYPVYADIPEAFLNHEVWVFGLDSGGGTTNQRIGRNIIDWVGTQTGPWVFGPVLEFAYNTSGPFWVGGDEQVLVSGDSGGPEFALIDGTFYLAGINYYNWDASDGGLPEGSGGTRVSALISQVNAFMAPYGEQLTVVPEPVGLMLLAATFALPALRRPKRGYSPLAA